jgi:hypothetical protein
VSGASAVRRLTAWLVLIATISVGCSAPSQPQGPLEAGRKHAWVRSAQAGEVFTDGTDLLQLNGMRMATIVSVDSVGGDNTLKFLGASIAEPRRKYTTTQETSGWPPTDLAAHNVVPAVGAAIKPLAKTWHRQGYELLLGYRIERSDYSVRAGVRITYRVGQKTYEATIPSLLVMCPPKRPAGGCMKQAWPGS